MFKRTIVNCEMAGTPFKMIKVTANDNDPIMVVKQRCINIEGKLVTFAEDYRTNWRWVQGKPKFNAIDRKLDTALDCFKDLDDNDEERRKMLDSVKNSVDEDESRLTTVHAKVEESGEELACLLSAANKLIDKVSLTLMHCTMSCVSFASTDGECIRIAD